MSRYRKVFTKLCFLLVTISGSVLAQTEVKVPLVEGSDLEKAKNLLKGNGLKIGKISYVSDGCGFKKDQVAKQKPAAGTVVKRNSKVKLAVNKQDQILVPSVIGMTTTQADKAFSQIEGISITHKFEYTGRSPGYPCCEASVVSTTEFDQISKMEPEAGSNLVCIDKKEIITFRKKHSSWKCDFAVNARINEQCP